MTANKYKFETDPEMAFDDELGWLHKDSLEIVNKLRSDFDSAKAIVKDIIANCSVSEEHVARFRELTSVEPK